MTHEFKDIILQARFNQEKGFKSVLATVVHLDGSSYRKPGVRMLINENGSMVGAVSGGCVEKEVLRRAESVFKDGIAKIITYDGRYRLGCEGILYILIEPFYVSEGFFEVFQNILESREEFTIKSYFQQKDEAVGSFGSKVHFKNQNFSFNNSIEISEEAEEFVQVLKPCFKLLIIGGEHDAVKLCSMAALLGWDVDVITSMNDPKQLSDFPGAKSVSAQNPEMAELSVDEETAVVLMNHNYVRDLKYLLKLEPLNPNYIGILGSSKRRDQLQNELMHFSPDLSLEFLDNIYSPAGLNLGAITPEEIALSILSEILSVVRGKEPVSLKTITGKVHA